MDASLAPYDIVIREIPQIPPFLGIGNLNYESVCIGGRMFEGIIGAVATIAEVEIRGSSSSDLS